MYITDKIYKLFKTCCNIIDEPPSPKPYRRPLQELYFNYTR